MNTQSKSQFIAIFSFWLATGICSGNAFGQGTTSPNAVSEARNKLAYLSPSPAIHVSREDANAAYQAMRFEVALEQYKTISQSAGSVPEDLYWVGESYFHLNKFDEATKWFEEAIARSPRADKIRVRIVQAYMSANQPQVAKQKCTEYLASVSDPMAKQDLTTISAHCDRMIRFATTKRAMPSAAIHGVER
jgi:tetratricopeptide (TPR) repeat protein